MRPLMPAWHKFTRHGSRDVASARSDAEGQGICDEALSLDDTLAYAHSTLGTIELLYDWDWSAAEEQFKRTMELNPNNVWAHEWHSRALVTTGRTEEAITEAKLSIALDPSPLSWGLPYLGSSFSHAGTTWRLNVPKRCLTWHRIMSGGIST